MNVGKIIDANKTLSSLSSLPFGKLESARGQLRDLYSVLARELDYYDATSLAKLISLSDKKDSEKKKFIHSEAIEQSQKAKEKIEELYNKLIPQLTSSPLNRSPFPHPFATDKNEFLKKIEAYAPQIEQKVLTEVGKLTKEKKK